jgi:putative transcriptional regulator
MSLALAEAMTKYREDRENVACKELLTVKNSLHMIRAMENRVKPCREGAGWSQGELARRLGVSRQTVNAIETDKYDPSLPLALRMAKLFAVPVDQLFIDHWQPEEE